MSSHAPWIALSIDWMDSDQFDESTPSARLAWVCLLCHVSSQGRGGAAKVRTKTFARRYSLSERCVDEMLALAQKCGSVDRRGHVVTINNWRLYQSRTWNANRCKNSSSGEKPSTPPHPTPQIPHTPPTPQGDEGGGVSLRRGGEDGGNGEGHEDLEAAWKDFAEEATKHRHEAGIRKSVGGWVRSVRKTCHRPEDAGEPWYVPAAERRRRAEEKREAAKSKAAEQPRPPATEEEVRAMLASSPLGKRKEASP